jgi:hypothetical protein
MIVDAEPDRWFQHFLPASLTTFKTAGFGAANPRLARLHEESRLAAE